MNTQTGKPTERDVVVHVTFAAANQPYNQKFPASATLAEVLTSAMTFFGIHTDGTSRYFLLAAGSEQDPGTTVSVLAEGQPGQSRSIKLSLRTETTSGSR
ncbi:hypothetical protein EEW87_17670 (plasmid) [Janibacter melonis]|uniref:Uncharacterized protein n=1 Tax=Janibacter melonis TaxID=262209 RepID=A0A650GFW3_9MICO|nr:hypothetical protein [Janibacter melonis]QGX08834.1 hypothetical protein EEW87_17670 [Janibacter melonis]